MSGILLFSAASDRKPPQNQTLPAGKGVPALSMPVPPQRPDSFRSARPQKPERQLEQDAGKTRDAARVRFGHQQTHSGEQGACGHDHAEHESKAGQTDGQHSKKPDSKPQGEHVHSDACAHGHGHDHDGHAHDHEHAAETPPKGVWEFFKRFGQTLWKTKGDPVGLHRHGAHCEHEHGHDNPARDTSLLKRVGGMLRGIGAWFAEFWRVLRQDTRILVHGPDSKAG